MPRIVRLALSAAAAVALFGCATNPVTGNREFSLVTSAQEEQIGREGYPAVLNEFGAYSDAALQSLVDSVGWRLARVSHLPNLSWKFTVLDDPTVNAFAMPGGYIYVTRGILAHLNSEAQLAGILGHEIGHVTARHSAQRITQQQVAGLGLGLASLFSEGFARYSQAAQTALSLMFLKYGRDDENQSDELGVQYATAAGYDPREIPATYAMIRRVGERSGQRLPSFLSTHPDPGSREERTRALAAQAAAGKTGLIVRGRAYVQGLDRVVYGKDPRQGYFEGTRYYHPEMAFQMAFPEGWKTQDSRSAIMAATADGASQMQVTLTPKTALSPAAFVAELERAGRISASRGASETVSGYQAWVGKLAVSNSQGASTTLIAAFIRKSPELMFQVLGKSPEAGDRGESQILAAARSFRDLTDRARIDVQPNRVKVVAAPRAGDFMGLVQSLGAQAVGIEEIAILNNADVGQPVQAGELIKTVAAGGTR